MANVAFFPIDFTPGAEDVIIAKGKKYSKHYGNLKLRTMIVSKLENYVNAQTKSEKSFILMEMINTVRESSPWGGGFVRQDKETGRWLEADDVLAREKTSQMFRDALHEFYKSSRQNRRRKGNKSGGILSHAAAAAGARRSLVGKTNPRQTKRQLGQSPLSSLDWTESLSNFEYQEGPLVANPERWFVHKASLKTTHDINDSLFFLLDLNLINEQDNNPFEPRPIRRPNTLMMV